MQRVLCFLAVTCLSVLATSSWGQESRSDTRRGLSSGQDEPSVQSAQQAEFSESALFESEQSAQKSNIVRQNPIASLTIFVLAVFVGFEVITKVPSTLHTPLMSVTNAISGIILIGGMLHLSGSLTEPATILGLVAGCIAAINVAGGFLGTRRMLAMFHK